MTPETVKETPDGGLSIRALFCFFGKHQWLRVSTQANQIGFLDECEHCGRGRYLAWAGHGSSVGKMSAAQMQQWRKEVSQQNTQPSGQRSAAATCSQHKSP